MFWRRWFWPWLLARGAAGTIRSLGAGRVCLCAARWGTWVWCGGPALHVQTLPPCSSPRPACRPRAQLIVPSPQNVHEYEDREFANVSKEDLKLGADDKGGKKRDKALKVRAGRRGGAALGGAWRDARGAALACAWQGRAAGVAACPARWGVLAAVFPPPLHRPPPACGRPAAPLPALI